MNVATFPQPSLASQLAELRRERKMRHTVYPHLIASRKLTEHQAAYQNAALDGAIATLERLVDAQARGEPGRGEIKRARAIIDGLKAFRERALTEPKEQP